ncbi:MAG: WecB/TagA/CpsF family glycosyltransferase [Stackebrandtia sp.]
MAVGGVRFDALTAAEVVDRVGVALAEGRGGRIVTPNVDIVRQVRRVPEARAHVGSGDLVVADGAPLVWASRLARRGLPERVAGSDLIWSLSRLAVDSEVGVFLLGGGPGDEPSTARAAAERLCAEYPGLRVAGAVSPAMGFDSDPAAMTALVAELCVARPRIVFVGLGFPKQERLIARLAVHLPDAWFLGCGAAIDFVAGVRRRAPQWMQRSGCEWLHRLASEPRRLFGRYVVHDAPAAARLLAASGWQGLRRR